jgi:hypothetical protein
VRAVGKYDRLRDFLAARDDAVTELTMSFEEVGTLVGTLPPSARAHRAWWANDSKVQAQAWRAAGWHVQSVNQDVGRVVFVRGVVGGTHAARRDAATFPGTSSSTEIAPRPAERLRIFLCHSSADKATVRGLYARLRRDGLSPWLDEEDILPGQNWDNEIRRAIGRSSRVLVCLSKNAVTKRGYVQREIKIALDVADEQPEGSIFLIPVCLEPCDVPSRLSTLQWVDLFSAYGYERLLQSLVSDPSEVAGSEGLGPGKPRQTHASGLQVRVRVHFAWWMPGEGASIWSVPATGNGGPRVDGNAYVTVTNVGSRPITITHVWFATDPRRDVINPLRSLPTKALQPSETWQTWIKMAAFDPEVANLGDEDLARLGCVRLSNGQVISARLDRDVPPVGQVPGG